MDLNKIKGDGTATATTTGSMAYARAYHMSVVLPDGFVVAVGGQSFPVPFSDDTAIIVPGAPRANARDRYMQWLRSVLRLALLLQSRERLLRSKRTAFPGWLLVQLRCDSLAQLRFGCARIPSNSVPLLQAKWFALQPHKRSAALSRAVPAEMWNPANGEWTKLAPMGAPRTYHSIALLLPDGKVLSGGGGLCGECAPLCFSCRIWPHSRHARRGTHLWIISVPQLGCFLPAGKPVTDTARWWRTSGTCIAPANACNEALHTPQLERLLRR